MTRTRKEYLVIRHDRKGERAILGVFSSRKKADSALSQDAKDLASGKGDGPAFIEKGKASSRLVLPQRKVICYRVHAVEEDKICPLILI